MLTKITTKLFRGIYQYKIVLVCAGAGIFRSNDLDSALSKLKAIELKDSLKDSNYLKFSKNSIRTKEDLDFAFKLYGKLSKFTNMEIRVESPWVTIYTNNKADIDSLIKLDKSKVKYISVPPSNTVLDANTIVMPKIGFEYRITLGKTTTEHSTFVQWAEQNSKIKLTKSCKSALLKNKTWGGTHFYITGDKNLLMAKMHLGGSINKIERVVKAINT